MDQVKIKATLQIVASHEQEGEYRDWWWWTHKEQQAVKNLHEELGKALQLIDSVTDELTIKGQHDQVAAIQEWLLREIGNELATVEKMLRALGEAHSDHPEFGKYIATWNQVIPHDEIRNRLAEIRAKLTHVIDGTPHALPPQDWEPELVNRRSMLKIIGTAGFVTLTAGTIYKLLENQSLDKQQQAELARAAKAAEKTGTQPPPGIYLQFGAYDDETGAESFVRDFNQHLQDLNIQGIDLSTRIYVHGEKAPNKVITTHPVGNLDQAADMVEWIFAHDLRRTEGIGIIEIDEQGNITWKRAVIDVVTDKYRANHAGTLDTNLPLAKQKALFLAAVRDAKYRYKPDGQQHVDEPLIWAVIQTESSFKWDAKSRVGAMGLMQLMPAMWIHFHSRSDKYKHHFRHGTPVLNERGLPIPADGHVCTAGDYDQNIDAGVHMLSYLHEKYRPGVKDRMMKIIMAYNAGETRINKNQIPRETQQYYQKVSRAWKTMPRTGRKVDI